MNWKVMKDSLLDSLLPRMCCGCGERLALTERYVCPRCVIQLDRVLFQDWENNQRKRQFQDHPALLRMGAFAYYRRGSIMARMIHELKYHRQHELGVWLGRLAASELQESQLFDGVDMLVPVPLTRQRRWSRGFNQAERIAAGVSQVTGIPVDNSVLRRVRGAESQTHFSIADRLRHRQQVFRLTRDAAGRAAGRHLMLVDDVMTSGATVLSALQLLETLPGVTLSVFTLAWVHMTKEPPMAGNEEAET